jgi:hypothetical protein
MMQLVARSGHDLSVRGDLAFTRRTEDGATLPDEIRRALHVG